MSIENSEWETIPSQSLEVTPVEAITRAEIDSQISTAKRYPRNLAKAKAHIISTATMDAETAEGCFYKLPRGGKNIEGPSVRLAEIVASHYGNLRIATRIISVNANGENPNVLVEAVAHDLENNTAIRIEKRRRIIPKRGKTKVDDDDINLAANNCSAVAFRDATFKVVPQLIIRPALDAAMDVAKKKDGAVPMVARIAKALEAFSRMGIAKDRVLAKFGYTADTQITADDLEVLSGLRTAIKENEVSAENEFPFAEGSTPSAGTPRTSRGARNREVTPLDLGGKPASEQSPADTPPPFGEDGKEVA